MEPVERRGIWRADRVDVRLSQGRLDAEHVRAVAAEWASRFVANATAAARRADCAPDAPAARARALADDVAALLANDPVVGAVRDGLALPADVAAERGARGRFVLAAGAPSLERLYVDAHGRVALADAASADDARVTDVALLVARVYVELATARRRDLGERFLAAWAEAADDFGIYRVWSFHERLAALELARESIARDDFARARRVLGAVAATRPAARPRLVAVAGPIASGKSTVASRLAAELGAPVLCADATRTALVARGASAIDGWSIHLELTRRAEAVLDAGRSVVLDGGFRSHAMRRAAARLARDRGLAFLFTECRAREATLRRRLAERWERGDFEETGEDLLADWEPVGTLEGAAHVVIDTTQAAPRGLARVRRALPPTSPLVA